MLNTRFYCIRSSSSSFSSCSMMNAFSEGLELADKSGLDPRTLLDVLVRNENNHFPYARTSPSVTWFWFSIMDRFLLVAGSRWNRESHVSPQGADHDTGDLLPSLPSEASAEGHEVGSRPRRWECRVDASGCCCQWGNILSSPMYSRLKFHRIRSPMIKQS